MSFTTRKSWLEGASIILGLVGLVVCISALPALSMPTRLLADIIFWPPDAAQNLTAPETRLLAAIGGGVMLGWGATLWLLVRTLFAREPAAVKTIITTGITIWFVTDSTASILAGAPLNAVLNVAFLLLFLLPLRGEAQVQKQI